MESTNTLSICPLDDGKVPQRSEQAVAVPSTPIELRCSEETVICLVAMITGMSHYLLDPSAMFMAMGLAEKRAMQRGVSDDEFHRVLDIVSKNWERERRRNPLSGLF